MKTVILQVRVVIKNDDTVEELQDAVYDSLVNGFLLIEDDKCDVTVISEIIEGNAMRKTADECKDKLRHRTHEARLKLIFDWIKNDEIAFHVFEELVTLHQSLDKQDMID